MGLLSFLSSCLLLSSLPDSPIWREKGSKCQQRPDPCEARVAPHCGCFAFPDLCLLAQHTLASMSTVREFSSQGRFPTRYSSSQQPKQGEGAALALCASVTGHLPLGQSLLSQFHLPTGCAPLLGRLGAWVAGEWGSLLAGSCPSEVLLAGLAVLEVLISAEWRVELGLSGILSSFPQDCRKPLPKASDFQPQD